MCFSRNPIGGTGAAGACETEAGAVRCERVILAGGAWSSLFLRAHGLSLPQLSVISRVSVTGPLPELLPGAAAGVGRLAALGCPVVVVTNQRGVARGLLSRTDLEAVHARLAQDLAAADGRVDAVAVCPHDEGECSCRKPLDGLFREALARAPWADPRRCLMIGDMPSDLEPARGLGMRTERVGADRPFGEVVARVLGGPGPDATPDDVRRGEGHVP